MLGSEVLRGRPLHYTGADVVASLTQRLQQAFGTAHRADTEPLQLDTEPLQLVTEHGTPAHHGTLDHLEHDMYKDVYKDVYKDGYKDGYKDTHTDTHTDTYNGSAREFKRDPTRHRLHFVRLDVLTEELWAVDLVILRDLLFHLTPQQVRGALCRAVNR